jgi:hypothetical protein
VQSREKRVEKNGVPVAGKESTAVIPKVNKKKSFE